MSFESDWQKVEQRIGSNMSHAIRATLFQVSSGIIKGTPVDTGRAKNNWFLSVGSPDYRTTESVDSTKKGSISGSKIAEISEPISVAVGDIFYITNNLPYIYRLEFKGWSDQASAGWVRKNVQQFNKLLESNIRAAAQ